MTQQNAHALTVQRSIIVVSRQIGNLLVSKKGRDTPEFFGPIITVSNGRKTQKIGMLSF